MVSSNNLMARMDVLDDVVLATLEDDVCRPPVIEEAIRLALEELAPERHEITRCRSSSTLSAWWCAVRNSEALNWAGGHR